MPRFMIQRLVSVSCLVGLTACVPAVGAPEPGSTDPDRVGYGSWLAVGEIRQFTGHFVPKDWIPADGRELPIQEHKPLFEVLGTTYGGDGQTTFRLPSLPAETKSGQNLPYLISIWGMMPQYEGRGEGLAESLIGEIRLWASPHTPKGWLPCDGSELPVADYKNLFSVLGDRFGGNGRTTFKLPDLPPVGDARYVISEAGKFSPDYGRAVTERQVGELAMLAGYSRIPAGMFPTLGQAIPISQYQVLFSLLQTRFGGDGKATFALPNMTPDAYPDLGYYVAIEGVYPQRP